MDGLRSLTGKIVFWVFWPVSYLYVHGSVRTRVLVEAEGKILLVKGWHDSSSWVFPGGGAHKNEDIVLSAIREVAEEVDIYLYAGQLVDLGPDTYSKNGLSFDLQRYGCKLDKQPKTRKQRLELLAINWFAIADLTKNMVDAHTWRHLQAWKQYR